MKNKEGCGLSVKIDGGQIIISIGIRTLAQAASTHEGLADWNEQTEKYNVVNVVDTTGWSEDILSELQEEDEVGNSLITEVFNKAMLQAYENGSIGIEVGV